jgi:hypothetical protein
METGDDYRTAYYSSITTKQVGENNPGTIPTTSTTGRDTLVVTARLPCCGPSMTNLRMMNERKRKRWEQRTDMVYF